MQVSRKLFYMENFKWLCQYFQLQRVASDHGLILVDTKYEFGKESDGTVLLIDEVRCLAISFLGGL